MTTSIRASPSCSSACNIVLFGLSWPMIKIGLEAGSPLWLAAARATLSATMAFALLAALGRLAWPPRADWPVVLSVGGAAARLLLRLRQSRHAEPAGRPLGVLAYTASLWMVPLSLLIGEKVGWRALCSACCWASPASSCWPIRRASTGTTRS